jgi:peptidase E
MKEPKPVFLLAGGNHRHPQSMIPSLTRVIKECGQQKPRVAYLGVASGDNLIFYRIIKSLLKTAGAAEVFLVRLAKSRVNLTAARQALEGADAIFISGGEVDDGIRWLEQHEMVGFLKELYGRGKLFFGVSAGSIMMGTHWVRWENPQDDTTAELFNCLGFIPAIFDTHAEDEDWKELKMALQLKGPGARGYAIPIGGMLSADSRGQLTPLEKSLICYMNKDGQVQEV